MDGKDKAFVGVATGIVVIDQLTKLLVSRLPVGSERPIIGKVFSITHAQNTGAAFSILRDQNLLLIALSVAILITIALYYRKIPKGQLLYAALICGGAMGNLIDRVRLGYVTDFIRVSIWPAFNVADMAVALGALALAWKMWREE